jgi:putative Mg2+ transporter-C (MgtC) family protein
MDEILRILLAFLLGAVVGAERERKAKPAGLRTHILVCVSACVAMLVSLYLAKIYPRCDPSRIAAHLMSGVGFLGAGTIIVSGVGIRGLTTAASLWSVTGVGIAAGCGMVKVAIVATLFVVFVLLFFDALERRIGRKEG